MIPVFSGFLAGISFRAAASPIIKIFSFSWKANKNVPVPFLYPFINIDIENIELIKN